MDNIPNSTNIVSVSYTHLDVYKRQVYERVLNPTRASPPTHAHTNTNPRTHTHVRTHTHKKTTFAYIT